MNQNLLFEQKVDADVDGSSDEPEPGPSTEQSRDGPSVAVAKFEPQSYTGHAGTLMVYSDPADLFKFQHRERSLTMPAHRPNMYRNIRYGERLNIHDVAPAIVRGVMTGIIVVITLAHGRVNAHFRRLVSKGKQATWEYYDVLGERELSELPEKKDPPKVYAVHTNIFVARARKWTDIQYSRSTLAANGLYASSENKNDDGSDAAVTSGRRLVVHDFPHIGKSKEYSVPPQEVDDVITSKRVLRHYKRGHPINEWRQDDGSLQLPDNDKELIRTDVQAAVVLLYRNAQYRYVIQEYTVPGDQPGRVVKRKKASLMMDGVPISTAKMLERSAEIYAYVQGMFRDVLPLGRTLSESTVGLLSFFYSTHVNVTTNREF